MMRFCPRTFRCLLLTLGLFAGCLSVDAQSFASLRRSTTKSDMYAAVERALAGQVSVNDACQAIRTGDTQEPFGGKTPIYLVMDHLAKHPKGECQTAEKLLEAFVGRKDFDINLRYSSLLPPLAYLIRTNYEFLGERFSTDYISDNVLKLMIGAGARVNTYNADGASLMTFAVDTDNQYLQSYFVDQGLNLRHRDEAGVDDVYKLIDEGRLETLRKAIDMGSVQMTIEALKNDTKDIARYPELYNYLAGVCAKGAVEYSSLKTFRERFTDRKSLVQEKWETMARKETNQSKDFEAIERVRARFPDLEKITGPTRLSIYRAHVVRVDSVYLLALTAAKEKNYHPGGEKILLDFVEFYSKKTQFDPDGRMPKAKETIDFHLVCHALKDRFGDYYAIFSGEPRWQGGESADRDKLDRAESIVGKESKFGFGDFYREVTDNLKARRSSLVDHCRYQWDVYESLKAQYERKMQDYLAQAQAKRKADEALDNTVENLGLPNYRYKDNWGEFIFQSLLDFNKYRTIYFPDIDETGYIGKDKSDHYMAKSSEYWYKTETDAIIAEYAYLKYKRVRKKGQLGFFD